MRDTLAFMLAGTVVALVDDPQAARLQARIDRIRPGAEARR